jgi:hypothetical protein
MSNPPLQVSEEDRDTRDLVQTDVHVRESNFVALQVEMREKKGEYSVKWFFDQSPNSRT